MSEFRLPDLSFIPFFDDVSPEALTDLGQYVDWYSLPGGWPLFEVGDPSDSIYFVLSGVLGVFRRQLDGRSDLVGQIRAGEPVGEMSLVIGEPHSASVYALRDTELVRIGREDFERLVHAHPSLMQNLARVMLQRSRQTRRHHGPAARVYALISASPSIDLDERASMLAKLISKMGRTCTIAREGDFDLASRHFDHLERAHDVVLLVARIEDSAWSRFCLRQSDRLWVVARADAHPSFPLLPSVANPAHQLQQVDVVLVRHGGDRPGASPSTWVAAANASRVFYWRENDIHDCARLARVIAGLSVGIVLSGGGARAYAHIGVIRALREAGVPLDFIGGTSMGGIIGACAAMGFNDDEIERRIRKAFYETNPLSDYRLPVVALAKGRKVDDRLHEHFGDVRIEDLPIPFFCVSTDLTLGACRIHRQGGLRQALRASIALPGILPPVVDGESVLVDGAVINNFPVDVMQDLHRGFTIGVDVARQRGINARDFVDPPNFFSWVLQHGMKAAPPLATLLMRTATLTVNPWAGREHTDLLIVPELSKVELRDWRAFDEAVPAGYEAAVARLKELSGPFAKALNRDRDWVVTRSS